MWCSVSAKLRARSVLRRHWDACHKHNLPCTSFCNCHSGHDCLYPFTTAREIVQSAKEETETDCIDSNLPDGSDDGLKQDIKEGGVPNDTFRTIWMSVNKDKAIKGDLILYFVSFVGISVPYNCWLDHFWYLLNILSWSSRRESILAATLGVLDTVACKNDSRIDFYIPNIT